MARKANRVQAVGYMRTSSRSNVGPDRDSEKRQRASIEAFAKAAGYEVVEWFYDAAVKGADPVDTRPGFKAMLDRIEGNGVRSIIVESPDRFARDTIVQITGHELLKKRGIALVPSTAPDFFIEDTATAKLVRTVLGGVYEFEKATLVAKLRGARERKRATGVKVEGRRTIAQVVPRATAMARELRRQQPEPSYAAIADMLAAAGFKARSGKSYFPQQIFRMVAGDEPVIAEPAIG
jgi:DNA invertase Pin-like site-specific DNA recombinase